MTDPQVSNTNLLSALASRERVNTFPRGTTIFPAGEQPTGVHVLLSGEVDLVFTGKPGTQPLRFNVSGTILGLSSIVSGRPHEYSVVPRTTVMTGFVDRDTFFAAINKSPALWFDVLKVLSQDISSCYERVKAVALP